MSTVTGTAGDDSLPGTSANDLLLGLGGKDTLSGGTGNDTLDGGTGDDTLDGGQGDDVYIVDSSLDLVQGEDDYLYSYYYNYTNYDYFYSSGNDAVHSSVDWILGPHIEHLVLTGGAAISGSGNELNNTLTGNAAANMLTGGAGADRFVFAAALSATTNVDTITDFSRLAADKLYLDAAIFTAFTVGETVTAAQLHVAPGATTAADADDRLIYDLTTGALYYDADGTGGVAVAVQFAVLGTDTHPLLGASDIVIGRPLLSSNGNEFVDGLDAGDASDWDGPFTTVTANSMVSGSLGFDTDGIDVFTFVAGANGLWKASLSGLTADVDISLYSSDGFLLTGSAYGGRTSEYMSYSVTEGETYYIEVFPYGATTSSYLLELALVDEIVGTEGADSLDLRGAGGGQARGAGGDDLYYVDELDDIVVEDQDGGLDTVDSLASYTIAEYTENLVLSGVAAIDGTGNALDNALSGNAAANVLDGGDGADSLAGGGGNDTYYVDVAGDVLTELDDGGIDHVFSRISYTLGSFLEDLTLEFSSAAIGIGNTSNNRITGNTDDNTLDGGAGADTLRGGYGDDLLIVDELDDVAIEESFDGNDTLQTPIGTSLADLLHIENLVLSGSDAVDGSGDARANRLTGNSAANTLSGLDGDDSLDGGAGVDVLVGGAGDDTYLVDSTTDTLTEAADSGTDEVRASVGFSLAAIANIENLALLGATAINGTGNSLGNVLSGNDGANVLDGGGGVDTLNGGLGDDTFVVDTLTDTLADSGGADTVRALITFSLASHATLENLTLDGDAPINGTGNALANVLTGNSAANLLDGGTGIDALRGGLGNDVYLVDSTTDTIVEAASAGIDLVRASVSFSLVAIANVENLTLSALAAVNGTGNALPNTLTGNAADNLLNGGAGADILVGGSGNDTYVIDNAGDRITEGLNGGTADLVRSSVSYSLATAANVENLTLTGDLAINATGNALPNRLTGNSADNILEGGQGLDLMYGGAGNDTYIVDNSADTVFEAANAGTSDTVRSPVDFVLTAGVERLVLVGTLNSDGVGTAAADRLEGNSGNNELSGLGGNDTLIGNGGNDTLIGGTGGDSMVGGVGNDVYQVDATLDRTIEIANGGLDRVESVVTFTLAPNIESLVLLGTGNISGTGNTLSNRVDGNSGNNRLTGLDGNDTLNGSEGADSMLGGAGDDTYYVQSAGDIVTEVASAPLTVSADAGSNVDTVIASISYTLTTNVEHMNLAGSAGLSASGNILGNKLTGNSGANLMDGKSGVDTLQGGLGNDTYVVDLTADVVIETGAAGGGVDVVRSSASRTIDAFVESLVLTGGAAINATGNAAHNRLTGNTAANVLNGDAGADTLTGGGGNDVLVGKLGADVLSGGTGSDAFVFDTALSAANADTITDFAHLTDKVRLDDDIFTRFTAGVAVTTAQWHAAAGATAAHDADDRLIYNTSTGVLYYDADGTGLASSAIRVATFGTGTHPALTQADFLIIG